MRHCRVLAAAGFPATLVLVLILVAEAIAVAALPARADDMSENEASLSLRLPQDPDHLAFVTTKWGLADVNRCAVDPIGDLNGAIDPDPSYFMAYRSGADACSLRSPVHIYDELDHRQSIQRLFANNRNYLLVTGSMNPTGFSHGFTAGFDIVEMGSRGANACQLGSGGVNGSHGANCTDRVVAFLGEGNTTFYHAGGMQVLGRYASIAYEGSNPEHFRIADLSDPSRPVYGEAVLRQRGDTGHMSSTCLTKLADGRFLLIAIGGSKDDTDAEIFVSTGTRMSLAASFWQSVNHRWIERDFPLWEDYENFQCVTACDGRLFAVGTHRNSFPAIGNEDWADIWQISLDPTTFYPTFSKRANRHMYCDGHCEFGAGAGTYVDPNGRLYVYGVEDHESASGFLTWDVEMREFVPPQAASCVGATCLEGSCFSGDGTGYISHYTGIGCAGTEYYYTPYFFFGYHCRPWDNTNATCGAGVTTSVVRSYRDAAGNCVTAWKDGNLLANFARVYRVACGEDSGCVVPDGTGYFSHYTGPNCSGTEYYYTPYVSNGYKCRPGDPTGAICGNLRYNTVVRSVRDATGLCTTPWPLGNPLTNFARVFR